MGDKSKIGWTDATWGPVTGCSQTSPGCANCFAKTLAEKFRKQGVAAYQKDGIPPLSGPGFGVTLHPDRLDLPLRWKKPRMIFVNSMSDWLHPEIPDEFIVRMLGVMAAAPQHTFQILTKRSQRLERFMNQDDLAGRVFEEMDKLLSPTDHPLVYPTWPLVNVWQGVSVENQRYVDLRIPHLLATPAAVRFLSCEPMLGPIDLNRYLWLSGANTAGPFHDYTGRLRLSDGAGRPLGGGGVGGCAMTSIPSRDLSWLVVGGESGAGFRPMEVAWAEHLVNQCKDSGVPCFVKQDSGRYPGKQGRLSDEMWAIKEFPS